MLNESNRSTDGDCKIECFRSKKPRFSSIWEQFLQPLLKLGIPHSKNDTRVGTETKISAKNVHETKKNCFRFGFNPLMKFLGKFGFVSTSATDRRFHLLTHISMWIKRRKKTMNVLLFILKLNTHEVQTLFNCRTEHTDRDTICGNTMKC